MKVHVCAYFHTYIHTYIHYNAHIFTNNRTYTCAVIHTSIHTYMYTYRQTTSYGKSKPKKSSPTLQTFQQYLHKFHKTTLFKRQTAELITVRINIKSTLLHLITTPKSLHNSNGSLRTEKL
jgi:hypothetical protein